MPISPNYPAATGDAIDLLTTQHQEVKRLFSQLAQGGAGRRESFEALVRLLAAHETAEEEIVYPVLRSIEPDGELVADEGKAEEAQVKQALADLERLGVDDQRFDAQLEVLRLDVLDHAESEEREVFPRLRSSLEPEELRSMRAALEMAEEMAPTHPRPHGSESAVGNVVIGPFVAVADRVRDTLRRGKRRS